MEAALGCKLPESYLHFMKVRNGGYLEKEYLLGYDLPLCGDSVLVGCFFPLPPGECMSYSGYEWTKFVVEHWEYPAIGYAIGEGMFGLHEVYFLDYRECGANGEPRVVHVDQEAGYRITHIADTFEEFLCKLTPFP